MKTWTSDNPKATLMNQKRALIVNAAREAFLEKGYSETSMDRIAASAKVSIKTVYRHFENKDDLFSAVMEDACQSGIAAELLPASDKEPAWFEIAPKTALAKIGELYLRHVLEPDQLALFRVVSREAGKFPDLAARYQKEVIADRDRLISRYLDKWKTKERWKLSDSLKAARFLAGMLRSGVFENAILGFKTTDREVSNHAKMSAKIFLDALSAGNF